MLQRLDAALAANGRNRKDFEIIVTPSQESPEVFDTFAHMGVDRLVLHMGSQRPEKLEKRLAALEQVVKQVA